MSFPQTRICALAVFIWMVTGALSLQITDPAPKATWLALHPNPMLRWVYSDNDPDLLGIHIRQLPNDTDTNGKPRSLYRKGTLTEWGEVAIPMDEMNVFESGMNITIDIRVYSDNDVLEQKSLDQVGPLFLLPGSDPDDEVIPASDATSMTESSSTRLSPKFKGSSSTDDDAMTTTDEDSSPTSTREHSSSTTTEEDNEERSSSSTSNDDDDDDSFPSSSSEADRTYAVTCVYIVTLVLSAIPAFIIGFGP